MKKFRQNRRIIKATNENDPATSSVHWGKRPKKHYKGCAGKEGKTTNFEIPEGTFERELKEMKWEI